MAWRFGIEDFALRRRLMPHIEVVLGDEKLN
jgi:hypothetical protein